MKKLFITLVILFTVCVFNVNGQEVNFPIDSITGKITYTEVISVEDKDATDLFLSAKEWFVNNFVSAKNVIQMEDKNAGIILGKGKIPVYTNNAFKTDLGFVEFTIKIEVKDGRYKYTLKDLYHKPGLSKANSPGTLLAEKPGGGLMTMGLKNWNGIKSQTDEAINSMIESLINEMNKNVTTEESW